MEKPIDSQGGQERQLSYLSWNGWGRTVLRGNGGRGKSKAPVWRKGLAD